MKLAAGGIHGVGVYCMCCLLLVAGEDVIPPTTVKIARFDNVADHLMMVTQSLHTRALCVNIIHVPQNKYQSTQYVTESEGGVPK